MKLPDMYKKSCLQLPSHWVTVGGQVSMSFYGRNCMKYADLYRKIIYGTPLGGMGSISKACLVRIQMKCPDLHTNVRSQTPTNVGLGCESSNK